MLLDFTPLIQIYNCSKNVGFVIDLLDDAGANTHDAKSVNQDLCCLKIHLHVTL